MCIGQRSDDRKEETSRKSRAGWQRRPCSSWRETMSRGWPPVHSSAFQAKSLSLPESGPCLLLLQGRMEGGHQLCSATKVYVQEACTLAILSPAQTGCPAEDCPKGLLLSSSFSCPVSLPSLLLSPCPTCLPERTLQVGQQAVVHPGILVRVPCTLLFWHLPVAV